jgi:hypothetical protein
MSYAADVIEGYKQASDKGDEPKNKEEIVVVEENQQSNELPKSSEPFESFVATLAETIKKEKESKKINDVPLASQEVVPEKKEELLKSDEPLNEILEPTPNPEEPFESFVTTLAQTLKKEKELKKINEPPLKETSNDIEIDAQKSEEPFESFIAELGNALEKEKKKKSGVQSIVKELKASSKTKVKKEKTEEENNVELLNLNKDDSTEKKSSFVSKYAQELARDSKNEIKPSEEDVKIKSIVAEQINKVRQVYPNIGMSSSGGGTNAVQYADGGTMNGDLNVLGRYLSGGVDLAQIFSGSNNGIPSNALIPDPSKFIFAADGVTTNFTVSGTNNSSNASLVEVFVDNVRQLSNSSYTLSGDIVKFIDPPDSGSNIVIITPNYQTVNGLLAFKGDKGDIGPIGQSAYEIWRDNGNLGSEQEFLDSLIGPVGIEGPEGIQGENGFDGQSAYDIWRSNGNSGSEQDFLDSLVGPVGEQGIAGPKGENSYQVWLSAGNDGTVSDYLSSLKGVQGDIGETGQSAYDIWTSEGNVGSEQDFLNSLVGPKGDTGDTVRNTDDLIEGSVHLFYRSDRVISDAPVKSVATKTGDVTLEITDINNLQSTLNSKQPAGNYVELVNNLIPTIHLPGSVDEIQEYTTFDSLTSTGTGLQSVLYITLDNNKVYRWGGSTYVEIVGSPGTTDSLLEGSLNKYFTIQRAASAAPVQSVANKTGNVLLEIQDIQNLQPSLTSTNTTTTPITAKLSSSLGAYSNNTVIPANTPFETILKNLLTTVIPAVYTQPTLSVSISPTTLSYEIGTNISPTLTPNFNKGSAGDATQFRIKSGASILSSTSTSTPLLTSFQLNANTTFTTEVDYGTGPQLYDNIGNPSGTPPPSGTRTATTTFIPFRNNYYTADTTTTAASDSTQVRSFENSTTSRSFNINIQAGDKRVSFAFPTSLSNINVQVVQVGVGNITTAFTNTTVSVAGANNSNSTNYRVYTYLVSAGYPQAETYSVSF